MPPLCLDEVASRLSLSRLCWCLHPKVACCLMQCTKQPDCILDTRRYGMANPWRKALPSFLSIAPVAGLLPCTSFYGSACANDAETEGSAVEVA